MIVTPYSFSILVTFSNIGPFKTPKNYFGRKCSPLPSHVIPNSTELYEDYEISASQQYRRTPFTNSTAKSGVRTTRNQGNDLFRHSDDWSTPHVPHRPPSPAIRGNDGSLCTCERNTRASSVAKRFWHGSSLVSPRANFSKAKRSYYY